jgi:phosphoserine phosphatase RsbU/P
MTDEPDERPAAVRPVPGGLSLATRTLAAPGEPLTLAHVTDAQVRILLDVSRQLAVPGNLDEMMCRVAEAATALLHCERASIFLHDPRHNELWTKVALGANTIRLPSSSGIVGHCFTCNTVLHVADPYADPRFNSDPDRLSGFVTRNLLSAPMAGLDARPVGVIQAVNKEALPFAENDLALIQLLADQAGVALQRHQLQQQALEAAALKHEMELARRAQRSLVPRRAPDVAGLSCAGWTLPANSTGGDCYDLWKLPDGRLGILVADASGHGLAPALIVTQVRTLVRTLSDTERDPHQLLDRVNVRMIEDLQSGQFVTAFLGFLSPDGLLNWTSAGHGPLPIRLAPGDLLSDLGPPVQPLGVIPWFQGAPDPVQLAPGGSLLVPSDGIFEAFNNRYEQFGVEQMCQKFDEHRDDSPDVVVRALREAVRTWSAGCEPLDDQTIVVVKRL